MKIFDKLANLQRVSVPIVAVETPDANAFISRAAVALSRHEERGSGPKWTWDIVSGIRPTTGSFSEDGDEESYTAAFESATGVFEDGQFGGEYVPAVMAMVEAPENSVLFMHLGNRLLENADFIQAILNVRDIIKGGGVMIVLVDTRISLPAELRNSIVVLDEPLPDDDALTAIVKNAHSVFGLEPNGDILKSVAATRGLSAFAAEQYATLSMTPEGMDDEALWEAKRKLVEDTPGVSFWRGKEGFDSIGGSEAAKEDIRGIMTGRAAPELIVVVEEVEKVMAGVAGDNTGVSQDILAAKLDWMEVHGAVGYTFAGVPGSGKSALAKATGPEFGVPTIVVDIGAVKSSGVGDSESNWRALLKTIDALVGGRHGVTLWFATSNGLKGVSSALLRRYKLGTYMFDLPEQNKAIWDIHRAKWDLEDDDLPDDKLWTGAEIATCCERAWRRNCSLKKAATTVRPYAISHREELEAMRNEANGRYNSAEHEGAYAKPGKANAKRKASLN